MSTGWKKGRLTIAHTDGPKEVPGWTKGAYGIEITDNPRRLRVLTHLATGRACSGDRDLTVAQLKELADWLTKNAPLLTAAKDMKEASRASSAEGPAIVKALHSLSYTGKLPEGEPDA